MINYEVDPDALRRLVPRTTELDLWQGRALVSVVGFLFLDTRVMGLPVPFHRNFEEINLRFYVRHQVGDEWRRGVVFVKEIVPRRAIAWVARSFYNENYVALPTSHAFTPEVAGFDDLASVRYACKHDGGETALDVVPKGPAFELVAGSEEEFIAQHYWGYSRQRDGGTVEYQVEHPPWRIRVCESAAVTGNPTGLYGEVFADSLGRAPTSAFLAEGSEIRVHRGRRVVL